MGLNLMRERSLPFAPSVSGGFFTSRLRVSPFKPEDALLMGTGFESPDVWRFSRGIDSIETAAAWLEGSLEDPSRAAFALRMQETCELAGFCVLSRRGVAQVEVGGWLSTFFWNRGLGGELLSELKCRMTDERGGCPLVAEVDPANGAAIHLLERAGFVPVAEGRLWVVEARSRNIHTIERCRPNQH